VFIKICGITSEEDALLAVALGADALGFVFAPSPRQVTPALVADIVKRLPAATVTVGVFRDESPERVISITRKAGLMGVQLHGHESPALTRQIAGSTQLVIKAFRAGDEAIERAADYGADAVLVDSPQPGSGEVFDWKLTEGIGLGVRLILAGGLTPDNVASAIARVRPFGVDVSTGVEAAPGRKDPVKLRRFLSAARQAEPSRYRSEAPGPYDWREEW
jgi:phosphoribosylanthranilate isomerase